MVVVHLHTVLQIQTEQGSIRRLEIQYIPGINLNTIIEQIGIVLDEENTLLVVNGRLVELDQPLKDGDEVHLIPAISGG